VTCDLQQIITHQGDFVGFAIRAERD
jgi:hypothetical protein